MGREKGVLFLHVPGVRRVRACEAVKEAGQWCSLGLHGSVKRRKKTNLAQEQSAGGKNHKHRVCISESLLISPLFLLRLFRIDLPVCPPRK